MTNNIAIYGAGGLGREVLSLLHTLPEWNVTGFFDDGVKVGAIIDGLSVLGGKTELLHWAEKISVVIAIGDPKMKRQVHDSLKAATHITFPSLIHPQALIMNKNCKIGRGSILSAGCILTTNVILGDHVLINLNATVGHDSVIGNYSSIMPGVNLAGAVEVGEAVLLGSGANVLSCVTVGDNSIIGAGSVVNHSIGSNVTAVGIPARVMKQHS